MTTKVNHMRIQPGGSLKSRIVIDVNPLDGSSDMKAENLNQVQIVLTLSSLLYNLLPRTFQNIFKGAGLVDPKTGQPVATLPKVADERIDGPGGDNQPSEPESVS